MMQRLNPPGAWGNKMNKHTQTMSEYFSSLMQEMSPQQSPAADPTLNRRGF
jgi:hypothetical protein